MSPVKEQLIRLIQEQPDDSTTEELLREIAFVAMVDRGLADSDAGRTISNEEMARRIQSWRR
jgi:predicted transcriptional regulator